MPADEGRWTGRGRQGRGDDGSQLRRGVLYLLAGAALGAATLLHPPPGWGDSFVIVAVLGTVSATFAVVVGLLAAARWGVWGNDVHFLLGAGFLGAGVLFGLHVLVALGVVADPPARDVDAAHLFLTGNLAGRTFLAACLVGALVAWRRKERRHPPILAPGERWVYVLTAVGITAILLAVSRTGTGTAGTPGAFGAGGGLQLVPALFFAAALVGFWIRGTWRHDPVEHGLLVALVFGLVQHGALLPFAEGILDPRTGPALALEVVGYAAVFVGLLGAIGRPGRSPGDAPGEMLGVNRRLMGAVSRESGAEEVFRESERRLRDFLDHANDLIQSAAPDGRLLYVNETWKRTLGYTDEDLRFLDIFSVVHPESRERFRAAFDRVLAGESLTDFEVSFRTRSGERVIVSGSSNCRFENGEPVATRSIFRDVTEQRRTERELAESQANVRALFESTGDPIWSVDRKGRLLTFNTAYALTVEAITGREPEPGDPLEEVMDGEELDWFRACFRRALAGHRFSEVREERVDGIRRAYELYFNPIQEPGGVGGVVVFGKDITRRQEAEEALRRAKREAEEGSQAKSQFLASMSHELRTPLNSVIGFANLLLKDPDGRLTEKERGFLERILANGKHLLQLINEILDLSKVEAGQMELELEEVALGELVTETVAQMEGQMEGSPVTLRHQVPAGLAPIETDPNKLKQILINLVGNALKFTEEGEVVVRVEASDGTPERIVVSDTGVGIPEDRLRVIFEAFQQGDEGTARRFGGTGLGLTITRSFCHLLGYSIEVESEEGEGSTFIVDLGGRGDGEEVDERGVRSVTEGEAGRASGNGPGLIG